jgi:hypothetical protein
MAAISSGAISASVENAALQSRRFAMRDRGMEFGKLGFKLLIDQQQRFQSAANIAIATRHDFIDRGLMKSGTHRKASKYPR